MNKNKIINILIIVFSLVLVMGIFTACQTETHEHKYTYYVSKSPTCTVDGSLELVCDCGQKEFQTITAGHTRDEDGVCTVCGDGKTHEHVWTWSTIISATCTSEGLQLGVCACGGNSYSNLEKLTHSLDANGICSVCGNTESHTHEFTWTTLTESTCIKEGLEIGVCVCGTSNYRKLQTKAHEMDANGICGLCGDKSMHTHVWENNIIVEPTCIKEGLELSTCECGEISYNKLPKIEHQRDIDGICILCNDGKIFINDDEVLGFDVVKIGELFNAYGYPITIEDVKLNADKYTVSDIKIDNFNNLNFTLMINDIERPMILNSQKVEFDVSVTSQLDYVKDIKVRDNQLRCVFADGTEKAYGLIEELTTPSIKTVKSIFINQENILFVTFSDKTAKVIGKIATTDTKIDGADYFFAKISGKEEYAITGVADKNLTEIVIPATHRGLPVTKIEKTAFYNNVKIVKVVLGENITTLAGSAFANCTNLKTVVINSKLKSIGAWCFYNNTKLTSIIIPDSVNEIQHDAFSATYCSIYSYAKAQPVGWAYSWVGKNNNVYWLGDWELINGVPVPLQ